MAEKQSQPQIEIAIDVPQISCHSIILPHLEASIIEKPPSSVLSKFHAGYFRISLSLCSQALLWKTLGDPADDPHAFRQVFSMLPPTAFSLLWSLALFTLLSQSLLYILRCLFRFELVKKEFFHPVGVNYLFAPWISWLLLLQSSPFLAPSSILYQTLCCAFVVPVLVLDVKLYGQWFTKGPWLLWTMANPTSQISVIGNLVGAMTAARMGWTESAVFMFSLGIIHYLVLFVTLYQRLSGSNSLPEMLTPTFFLFIAAPSMASLAWDSISGRLDVASKMLFFLSLFLFFSLVCRPTLFERSMRKFSIAWWAYSFPLTVLALASTEYAKEVTGSIAHTLMLLLTVVSVFVTFALMVITALSSSNIMFSRKLTNPVQSPAIITSTTTTTT
ncbi:hypothetical protein F2P56_001733 [Juglans regia]|uniref:S-type anion channel SLAH1-like n=2 Tax=Juglans regia TaxID=51240 RepID=A0A834D8V2_JUGRE|nr:S-type anion channel SLAH1-like [Juglans regia]KAF5481045.1 hypothetical protein F2P56_001733 [Juglans regia]